MIIEARDAAIWYMYHQRGATKAAFTAGSGQSMIAEGVLNRLIVAKPPLFGGAEVHRR